MYLLGCLLTFYQQCRIWHDRGAGWKAFNPAKPLWVFLGKTVTGSSKADRATRSDVVRILRFLGWVLARGDAVRPMIARLLQGRSGTSGRCRPGLLCRTVRPASADGNGTLRRSVRSPVPRTGTPARGLSDGRRGRVAPAGRGQRTVRGGQRGRLGGALQAVGGRRQSRLRRRARDGLCRAPLRRRRPAGLDGERGHRGRGASSPAGTRGASAQWG